MCVSECARMCVCAQQTAVFSSLFVCQSNERESNSVPFTGVGVLPWGWGCVPLWFSLSDTRAHTHIPCSRSIRVFRSKRRVKQEALEKICLPSCPRQRAASRSTTIPPSGTVKRRPRHRRCIHEASTRHSLCPQSTRTRRKNEQSRRRKVKPETRSGSCRWICLSLRQNILSYIYVTGKLCAKKKKKKT